MFIVVCCMSPSLEVQFLFWAQLYVFIFRKICRNTSTSSLYKYHSILGQQRTGKQTKFQLQLQRKVPKDTPAPSPISFLGLKESSLEAFY